MAEAVNEAADPPSDAILVTAVRRGDVAAYGLLYQRHLGAARRAAAGLVATTAEREDLVAEAFTRVLRVLRTDTGGPIEGFRPYLLATMRHAVISWGRRPAPAPSAEIPDGCQVTGRDDPVGARVHASVAADAFASLPERWRTVLWHTEVEGESPAEIAPLLGMTPNGVAALAYRARNGLRRAYLEQYLPAIERQDCQAIVEALVGWVRNRFGARKMSRIAEHLDRCADCRWVAASLKQVNNELPATVAPIILGAPLAVAYLSTSAGTTISSGATLAGAVNSGVSTVSWLTTAKTIVAGAAIVTTTAVSTVASDPAPPSVGGDNSIAVSVPEQPSLRTPHHGPDRAGSTRQGPPRTSVPIPPSPPGAEPAAPAAGETGAQADAAKSGKQQAKQEKKAAKQAEKAVKHEAKESVKNTKKEPSTDATPVESTKQKSKR